MARHDHGSCHRDGLVDKLTWNNAARGTDWTQDKTPKTKSLSSGPLLTITVRVLTTNRSTLFVKTTKSYWLYMGSSTVDTRAKPIIFCPDINLLLPLYIKKHLTLMKLSLIVAITKLG